MKKIILTNILVLGFLAFTGVQSRLDTINIHKRILKVFNLTKSNRVVELSTDKQLFININLPNPSYNTLDTISNKFWHQKDWSNFLAKIDTSLLKNYDLKTINKRWFKNKVHNEKKEYHNFFSCFV